MYIYMLTNMYIVYIYVCMYICIYIYMYIYAYMYVYIFCTIKWGVRSGKTKYLPSSIV